MELQEIRKEINKIDDAMRELFEERLSCSENVAAAKLQTEDCIYKPEREKEVLSRFAETPLYRLNMRKIMQLSRFFQYKYFLMEGRAESNFLDMFQKVEESVQAGAEKIHVKIVTEPELVSESKHAMSVTDILSLLGDFGQTMTSLQFDDANIMFSLAVPDTVEKKDAIKTLLYMLYKESMECQFEAVKVG